MCVHQKLEGLWDEESWFPGVVHNVVQKKGHANEYGVTFDDGDKGVYLSQQLRKHPDTVDGSPRFLLQPEDSSSSESDDESEDGSESRSSNADIESECTIQFLHAFQPPTDTAYGKEDHAILQDSEITFEQDSEGRFVALCPNFLKNHSEQVGFGGQHDRQEKRRIYQLQPDNPRDVYNMLAKVRLHKPANHTGRFYLYPDKKYPDRREKDSQGNPAWYASKCHIGHNELGKIVREVCTRVGQPVPPGGLGKWGGQGLRRSALTNCDEAGLNDTLKMRAGAIAQSKDS